MTRWRLGVLAAVSLACACDDDLPAEPRVPPADESRWVLVDTQIKLDELRPLLVALQGRSFPPSTIDELTADIEHAADLIDAASTPDQLRAARYAVDAAGVGADLVWVHAQATARGFGGVLNTSCGHAMELIREVRGHLRDEQWWPLRDPREADRLLGLASTHAENAMRVAPIANVLKTGVQAAAMTNAASSLARLVAVAPLGLARIAEFVRGTGAGEAVFAVEIQQGAGALRVVAGGGALVLTTAEAIALAQEGALSAAALQLFFRAAHLHHIATNKNDISDARGGPWTPRFKQIFDKAGVSLDDEVNLVKVEGHQGPHPEAYHKEVLTRLDEGTSGLQPSTPEYRAALTRTLRKLAKEIETPGTRLNALLTRGTAP